MWIAYPTNFRKKLTMPKASIIVTGATGSMGSAAVRALAAKGESVIAACRDLCRGQAMADAVLKDFPNAAIDVAYVDLSSIASINAFIETLNGQQIKGLFNNAGTLPRHFQLSQDGLELCMAVNYLAPFLLCDKIGALMAPGGHIVNMVSLSSRYVTIDRDILKPDRQKFSQLGTYARSKYALMLFSVEFARQHPELKVNVSDPGIVDSNMIRLDRWFDPLTDVLFRPFCKSPEHGVSPALRALEAEETGKLFIGKTIKEISSRYTNQDEINLLWSETEKTLSLINY